jgi:hypothetical protein
MAYIDQGYMATPTTNPGVYKYVHLGTAAGTQQIGPTQPILVGYVQINSHALGTIVAYDATGTSSAVIGSVAITSVSGSAPVGYPLWQTIATKNAFALSWTGNLDLTVAYLP